MSEGGDDSSQPEDQIEGASTTAPLPSPTNEPSEAPLLLAIEPRAVIPLAGDPDVPPPVPQLQYEPRPDDKPQLQREVVWMMGVPARDFWLPLILLCIGMVLFLGGEMWSMQSIERGMRIAIVEMGLNALAIVAIYLCIGRFSGIHPGPPAPALLKLAALALFPPGLAGVLMFAHSCFCYAVSPVVLVLASYHMFKRLGEMDFPEAALPTILISIGYISSYVMAHYFFR